MRQRKKRANYFEEKILLFIVGANSKPTRMPIKKQLVIVLDSDSDEEDSKVKPSKKDDIIEIIEDSPKKKKQSVTGKKRRRSSDQPGRKTVKKMRSPTGSATKFKIPSGKSSQSPSPSPSPIDSRGKLSLPPNSELWIDKYRPKKTSELPVNKKKLSEIKTWLEKTLLHLPLGTPNTPRMLILTGPTGGCKTTIIQVLCKELNCEVTEWIDPSLCLWKDSEGIYL